MTNSTINSQCPHCNKWSSHTVAVSLSLDISGFYELECPLAQCKQSFWRCRYCGDDDVDKFHKNINRNSHRMREHFMNKHGHLQANEEPPCFEAIGMDCDEYDNSDDACNNNNNSISRLDDDDVIVVDSQTVSGKEDNIINEGTILSSDIVKERPSVAILISPRHDDGYPSVMMMRADDTKNNCHNNNGIGGSFNGYKYNDWDDDDDEDEFLVADVINEEEGFLNISSVADESGVNTSPVTFADFNYITGVHNQLFYAQENSVELGGIRGIALRSSNPHGHSHVSNMAAEHDAKLLFEITDNLVNKPKHEQIKLLSMIKTILSSFQESANTCTDIPTDLKSANELCVEGNHSIFSLIPYPPTSIIDGHACVDLDGLLDHVLAMGYDLSFIQDHNGVVDDTGFNGTTAMKDLFHTMKVNLSHDLPVDKTAFGHLMFWSDGFDPFNSRRGTSIWMMIVRVCPPTELLTSECYNICIAFGCSSLNHESVVSYQLDQLEKIRRGKLRFYAKDGVKRMISTCFDLVLWAGDTPERRQLTHTSNRGNYGKRSNYAGKINQDKTPACANCYKRLIKRAMYFDGNRTDLLPFRKCNRCCCWDALSDSKAAKFDLTEGTDYPTTCSSAHLNEHTFPAGRTVSESSLVTVKQTFATLTSGMNAAFHEFVAREWTKAQVRQYLTTLSIDKSTREKLISSGDNKIAGGTVEECDYIPVMWSKGIKLGYDMEMFPELGMHLIGHGIVASMLDLLNSVLKEQKLWTKYIDFCNAIIADIPNVDWCKVKSLPKGNWLGENLFGYQRISLYLFGEFIHTTDLTKCDDFFTSRLDDLKRLLSSCHIMICGLMCKQTLPKERLDVSIKIFLSCCHFFCIQYFQEAGGRELTEFWFTKSNFMGLLNIPDQFDYYGKFRNYWDGSFERSVQSLKRVVRKGFRRTDNAMKSKMIRLHKYNAMDYIRSQFEDKYNSKTDVKRYQGGVKIYKNAAEIRKRIEDGKVVAVFFKEGQCNAFVPFSVNNDKFKFITFGFTDIVIDTYGTGMVITTPKELAMSSPDKTYPKTELEINGKNRDTLSFGLMIPSKTDTGSFYIITNKWEELHRSSSFRLPEYSDSIFSCT